MKIVIPGGHLTPALAFIEYIQAHHPDDEVVFCGRIFSQDTIKQKSQEAAEINRRGVPFIAFSAPRWDHSNLTTKLLYPLLVMRAVGKGLAIFWREKPDVMVSFGGYLAVPLALAAAIVRIPIVVHEQTRAMGMANAFVSRLAQKIALSFPESGVGQPGHKIVVTGNPVRTAIFQPQPQPSWITGELAKPIVYITGGNQGSEIINVTVQQALRSLLKDWTVIHQCGNPTQARHYRDELEKAKSKLPATMQARYYIREWLTETELGWIYQHTSVVVSRAGANTVQELAAHHLPSVLIPLPFAHGDEQVLNAQYLAHVGGALVLTQKDLNPDSLHGCLNRVMKYQRSMSNKLKQLVVLPDAAAKLYEVVSSVKR